MAIDLDIGQIKDWHSIVLLIVFVITSELQTLLARRLSAKYPLAQDVIVIHPFRLPIYLPRWLVEAATNGTSTLRITSPRQKRLQHGGHHEPYLLRLSFPMNLVTAPLIAVLFLLAILAIGRQELHDGTLGADNIVPLDIMAFFLTLAYIAISIDASGLIRYSAFKVLQWGGDSGPKLYLYLYVFFFGLGTFIGNDPIILSGTAFLAYMTRVSKNIRHPKAWIFAQFTIANTASAILVSSNPTNLVLAGAFQIRFIVYTANMIVPVVVTVILLFPFLLYVVFPGNDLIPKSIELHELPEEAKARKAVNPNIPFARGKAAEEERIDAEGPNQMLSLEEIMNPFVDKYGAIFGSFIMAVALITLLALNAASQKLGEHPVFWVTLPAAFIMFCWDLAFGWKNREETRKVARIGREEVEMIRRVRAQQADTNGKQQEHVQEPLLTGGRRVLCKTRPRRVSSAGTSPTTLVLTVSASGENSNRWVEGEKGRGLDIKNIVQASSDLPGQIAMDVAQGLDPDEKNRGRCSEKNHEQKGVLTPPPRRKTLVLLFKEAYNWLQETFPTTTAVIAHLPFALVPFAISMFILVQGLVTKGWVPVFAYGWDHWVNKTGTVGCIGGMGFLSAVLCNFAGTNIGTAILLSRVIQAWQQIRQDDGVPIPDRAFWGTVYSMALGLNYGAYSATFSASLAGLLWRDVLTRKHITVKSLEFARENLSIIAFAMSVGCSILVAEVYIVRSNSPYSI